MTTIVSLLNVNRVVLSIGRIAKRTDTLNGKKKATFVQNKEIGENRSQAGTDGETNM